MVFILYFQQATHVRPRPSLIAFDTYYVYIYMEENNVRVRYLPAFPLHLSHLHQLFAPDILYGPPSSLSSCAHFYNRLPEIGETNRAEFSIDSVYGPLQYYTIPETSHVVVSACDYEG